MPYILLKGVGYELITSHDYIWDGRNRTGDHCVLQFTLNGCGEIETGGKRYSLKPGDAFLADIPGDHIYRLPSDSTKWEVLYFELSHLALHLLHEWIDINGYIFRIEQGSQLERLLWGLTGKRLRIVIMICTSVHGLLIHWPWHLLVIWSRLPVVSHYLGLWNGVRPLLRAICIRALVSKTWQSFPVVRNTILPVSLRVGLESLPVAI